MSNVLRVVGGVVSLYVFAVTPLVAQEATSRFMRWNLEYQVERIDRAERLYSEAKVHAAATSPRATRELVLQMEATLEATKRMLVNALKAARTSEAKGAILDGLSGLELGDSEMAVVAREVALEDPWITALESDASRISNASVRTALNWLAGNARRDFLTAYPACDVLQRQGSRAVPVLRDSLANFAAGSLGFKNTARLLVMLASADENQAWALGDESSLSREQKDVFLNLLKKR
jgi:hypothetical protein